MYNAHHANPVVAALTVTINFRHHRTRESTKYGTTELERVGSVKKKTIIFSTFDQNLELYVAVYMHQCRN